MAHDRFARRSGSWAPSCQGFCGSSHVLEDEPLAAAVHVLVDDQRHSSLRERGPQERAQRYPGIPGADQPSEVVRLLSERLRRPVVRAVVEEVHRAVHPASGSPAQALVGHPSTGRHVPRQKDAPAGRKSRRAGQVRPGQVKRRGYAPALAADTAGIRTWRAFPATPAGRCRRSPGSPGRLHGPWCAWSRGRVGRRCRAPGW